MGKIKQLSAAQMFEVLEKHKKNFAVNPTELLRVTIENLSRAAENQLTAEMGLKAKNFEAKFAGSTWWEMAFKLYPISQNDEGEFVVQSEARDWEEEKTWSFKYKAEAYQKVEQLVRWLDDGRKRGYGDRDQDIERITDRLNEKEAA